MGDPPRLPRSPSPPPRSPPPRSPPRSVQLDGLPSLPSPWLLASWSCRPRSRLRLRARSRRGDRERDRCRRGDGERRRCCGDGERPIVVAPPDSITKILVVGFAGFARRKVLDSRIPSDLCQLGIQLVLQHRHTRRGNARKQRQRTRADRSLRVRGDRHSRSPWGR